MNTLNTLLLNSTYEGIDFIPERRTFKLLAKDRVEVLEVWEGVEIWFGTQTVIEHPAVIRLKHNIRWIPRKPRFSRTAMFRRDQYCCRYCGGAFTPGRLTLDHIVPRSRGGNNSWENCVTACFLCNNKKKNRTPEEAGMSLIKIQYIPPIMNDLYLMQVKHHSWESYL